MTNTNSWITRAEEYCRAEGVGKVVHPTKKYLYDLQGVGDDVTVALFDPEYCNSCRAENASAEKLINRRDTPFDLFGWAVCANCHRQRTYDRKHWLPKLRPTEVTLL